MSHLRSVGRPRGACISLLVSVLLLLTLISCTETEAPVPSSENVHAMEADLESGRINYMTYCLNCHGEEGRGDGPLNELIVMEPTDLTRLAAGGNRGFPADEVEQIIRGTDQIEGHGDREMPIWSTMWTETSDAADPSEIIDTRIAELIAYLVSIQQ